MGKRGPKFKRLEGPRHVDNTHGSSLWQYNHFRTSVLTNLLNDLTDLENDGMNEEICQKVQTALNYFVNASTEVPKGGFLSGGPLYKEIEQFLGTYREWNDINGKSPELSARRRRTLSVLRKRRQDISDKARRLQFELQNNLDQQILVACYKAIGDIINLVPGMFKNLVSSYKDYQKWLATAKAT